MNRLDLIGPQSADDTGRISIDHGIRGNFLMLREECPRADHTILPNLCVTQENRPHANEAIIAYL